MTGIKMHTEVIMSFNYRSTESEAPGGAVGWGTALQAGRSRVRFPKLSLEFFIVIIIPGAL